MRRLGHIFWSLVLALGILQAPANLPFVIYGEDHRLDYYQVNDQRILDIANGTVALVRSSYVEFADGKAHLLTSPYGTSLGLCPSEPFYNQETLPFCSGSLVAPDTVLTAGHCIRNADTCASTKIVFGFHLRSATEVPRSVDESQVYSCQHVIHTIAEVQGADFALIKLDRPVVGVTPLALRRSGQPVIGDPLVILGHPAKLPLKIAGGASVRRVAEKFLVANLDAYSGSSGSAVVNANTGLIEGVLVRGEMDFEFQNGCRVSRRCPDDGCRGEDVTLIEQVWPYLGR